MYAQDDVHLQLTGELDADGFGALDDCFTTAIAKGPRKLVLDLSGLGSIDPSGVDLFADLRRRADALGVQLVLDSPNPAVLDTIASVTSSGAFSIR